MKKIRRWITVLVIGVAIVTPVFLSVTSLNNTAFADEALTSGDMNAIRQNILYKSVYSNLQRCYNNMAETIDESPDSVWATFDSTTYFKNEALANNFLKFPFDVGKKNESSCPKMITGWKNNWFIDLFKGEGSYSGLLKLNTGAEVPDNSYNHSPTKMGDFLKNIGYTQKKDTTTMGDKKCFYLKFKINDAIYDQYGLYGADKGAYFETVDFCVKLDSSNNLQQGGDAITPLIGNNEYFTSSYDNGHLTDDSNITFIYFNTDESLSPQFRVTDYPGVSWANKNYLQANVSEVSLHYPSMMGPNYIGVKHISNTTNAEDSSYCSSLGYSWCGWFDKGVFYTKTYIGSLMEPGGSIGYSTFKSRLKSVVEHMQTDDNIYLFNNVTTVDYTPGATSYTRGATNTKFMKYFLGDTSNFNGGNLTDAEKYVLYYTYLKESYNVATTTTVINNGVQVSWLNDDGTFSKVYVYDPDENPSDKKYIPQQNQWLNIEEATWKEIAERMGAINVAAAFSEVGVTDPVLDPDVTPGEDSDDADGEVGVLDGCFSNAGVLGWILCPVLRMAGAATEGIYDMIIEKYLSVKSETMTSEALRESWGTFQGYANILFAILLVIVILSQVTGIGLSNYGIKKVLPRLIITIILVNLSYIACIIMVDLSNVVGTGLKDLLSGMDAGGLVASEVNIGTMVINSVEGIGLTELAIGAGAATIPIVVESWPNLILALFLAVISILISILFFFILLVVRQAAIIILVVVSPVAIVCYALPNTQKVFDRWLKMFSALLMVFPICGAVMGGCNYASRLLLSAGDDNGLLYYIIVMVLGVVPLFFIPSILKGSMSALGRLGAQLATAGDRFSRWTNRAIVGSQAFQDRKQEAQRNVNMARNKRIMEGTKLETTDQTRLATLRDKQAAWRNDPNHNPRLTGAERRELRQLSSKEFRYARAASARERALRDEIQSGTIANREAFDYGTDRYKAALEGSETAQRLSDVKDQKALYEAGRVSGVDADNIASLQAEHERLLTAVSKDVDGKDKVSRAKLEAVQELLGDKQDKGLEAMYDNYIEMSGDMGVTDAQLESVGVKNAVRHLRAQYAGAIKKGNRGFDNLITKLQNNGMGSLRTSVAATARRNGDTRALSELLKDDFAANTLAGYNAGSLNDMHDTTLQRYVDMAKNGALSGEQLSNFAKIVNEAFASGSINLKGEVGQQAQKFLEAAYGTGAIARTGANASSVVTAGSDAFKHASIQSLQQISSGLANGSISGAAAQRIVENARRYMESGSLIEPERAQELRQIITAAQGQGVRGLAGPTDRFDYNEASFKVRGAKQKVAMPTGWTRRPDGQWYDDATGNPLSGKDAVKAQQILEHNNSIDIEHGK